MDVYKNFLIHNTRKCFLTMLFAGAFFYNREIRILK